MKHRYAGLAERMLSELTTVSNKMAHQGEKGRNNETILADFLRDRLPARYTVSTGTVVAVGGAQSGQVDVIIHDRENSPGFVDGRSFRLVPIESVQAVISIKTTLNKSELRDAMKSLASVRSLPRLAALVEGKGQLLPWPEHLVVRPRALVFAFQSDWTTIDGFKNAFVDLLDEFDDTLRPNAVCVLNQGFILRRPYRTTVTEFPKDSLLHFFLFLVRSLAVRLRYVADLEKYFDEDYGLNDPPPTKKASKKQAAPGVNHGSGRASIGLRHRSARKLGR